MSTRRTISLRAAAAGLATLVALTIPWVVSHNMRDRAEADLTAIDVVLSMSRYNPNTPGCPALCEPSAVDPQLRALLMAHADALRARDAQLYEELHQPLAAVRILTISHEVSALTEALSNLDNQFLAAQTLPSRPLPELVTQVETHRSAPSDDRRTPAERDSDARHLRAVRDLPRLWPAYERTIRPAVEAMVAADPSDPQAFATAERAYTKATWPTDPSATTEADNLAHLMWSVNSEAWSERAHRIRRELAETSPGQK